MKFTKMQGAGNDFIIINNMELKIYTDKFPEIAKKVCERKVSLGADALMVVDSPEKNGDFLMRFYNSDGSIGEMCGNGARCIARYAYENKIAGETMTIETMAGDVQAWRMGKRQFKIRLNRPEVIETHRIVAAGKNLECAYIELGKPGLPHAVVVIDDFEHYSEEELLRLGYDVRHCKDFHKGANANIVQIMDERTIKIRTFERGVENFTLACGTGSGSSAAALTLKGVLKKGVPIDVLAQGGRLSITAELSEDEKSVKNLYLTGDTNIVAVGDITDEDLEISI